jgi:hypothetical protein
VVVDLPACVDPDRAKPDMQMKSRIAATTEGTIETASALALQLSEFRRRGLTKALHQNSFEAHSATLMS